MYKKNIKVGALVLALSFSAANLQAPLHTNTVYASEVSAPADENSTVDANSLKNLVDESAIVKKSKRYNSATANEKKAYDDAIANASSELDKENPENIANLYKAIVDAKDNLSGNVYLTSDARDGLSSTIAMANKLAADDALDETNKKSLSEGIDKANELIKDVEKSSAELDKVNSDLASLIESIIKEKNLDPKKYVLSEDELSDLKSADLAAYGKARTNLYELIDDSKKFFDANKDADYAKDLASAINAGVDVYNNVNAETADLQKAYESLNKALSEAQLAKDKNNTEDSRLRNRLTDLVNENFADKDKANKVAQSTYENAISYGQKVLDNKNASPSDYQRAIKSINMAKLALKPVETKTIDDGKTEIQRANEKLASLIDEANTIKNSDDYKNSDSTSKHTYDIAIEDAKKLTDKDKENLDKVNDAIKTIEAAKVSFDKPADDDNEAIKKEAKDLLDKLNTYTSDKDNVTSSNSYRNADDSLKKAYDDAIKEALDLQTKKANEKTITLEELKSAVSNVEKALKDMGYDGNMTYPDDLKALVDEAKDFRNKEEFSKKANSNKEYEKALISDYNKLIEDAKKYLDSDKNDQAVIADYVNRINDLKMAILDEISQVELELRGELRNANRIKNTEAYKTAKASTDKDKKKLADDYDELIEKATAILANAKRTDADMTALVEGLKNIRITLENPDERNMAVAKINEYMDLIRKVYAHPKYAKVAQSNKDRLEKAVKAVEETDFTKEVSKEKLQSLVSDLEAGLNASDIKEIVEEIKKASGTRLEDLVVKDLVDFAKAVKKHPNYKDVSQTQKKSFEEALAALERAIEENNQNDIELAKIRLISTLNQSTIKPITDELLAKLKGNSDTKLEEEIKKLQTLVKIAEKIQAHKNYANIDNTLKDELTNAISKAKEAVNSKDAEKISKAFNGLKEVLAKKEFENIIKDIRDSMTNEYKVKIKEILNGDATFRQTTKYAKAQKTLKEAYIKAIEDANKVLEKADASEDEIKDAHDKLTKAITDLDGDKYQERLEALAKKYKDNANKITDAKVKASLAEKIKALNSADKTMDDLIAVETELTNAIPKEGKVSATVTGKVTTPVTTSTTKTVPVTTSKTVPTTVTPGSVVRTGIKSVIGYVAVLALAILGYVFVVKKDKKGDKKVNKNDEKERMTSEGDKNDQYK